MADLEHRARTDPASDPPPEVGPVPWWRGDASALALRVGLLAVAAMLPALAAGFITGDDDRNFLHNLDFRGLGWSQIRWAWTATLVGVYQPVAWMLLEAEYAAWGLDSRMFHAASLALHGLNAAVLVLLTRAVLRRCEPGGAGLDPSVRDWASALAAALYAVHPLRAEVVGWASSQPYLPCTLFGMLSVLAYLHAHAPGRPRPSAARWLAGSYALGALAMLSKAPAVALPALLLILDFYPLRRLGRRALLEKLPLVAIMVGLMAVALVVRGSMVATVGKPPMFRTAQACYAAWFYLQKSVVPTGLVALYPFPPVPTWKAPRFLWGLAFTAGASVAAFAVRRRHPGLAATWAAYLVALAPSSGLVTMGPAMLADRYSYTATMVWVPALALGLARLGEPLRRRAGRAAVAAPALAVLLGLSGLSWYQCATWRNGEALWSHALEWAPDGATSAEIHNELGLALVHQGRLDEARHYFTRAVRLNPGSALAHNNLGLIFYEQGRPAEALPHFLRAQSLKPNAGYVYNNLGLCLSAQRRHADAAEVYAEALRLEPGDPDIRTNLGSSLIALGRRREGLACLDLVLRDHPGYGPARRQIELAQSAPRSGSPALADTGMRGEAPPPP